MDDTFDRLRYLVQDESPEVFMVVQSISLLEI